jgi:hypothetical protein
VLITAVDERPAAFGLVAAIELGVKKDAEIARIIKIDMRLSFIKCS